MSYGLGVLVPLHEEYQYLSELAPPVRTIEAEGQFYYEILPPGFTQPVVVQILEEMGPVRAAVAADRMFGRFKVPVLALLGIAGSLTDDALLGDVVVATEVDLYQYAAKATSPTNQGEFPFEQGGMVWRASHRTLEIARAFRAMPETREQYEAWGSTMSQRRPESWSQAHDQGLVRGRPDLVVGPVASGDIVGAATWFRDQLIARNRKLVAIEMEAAGVAAATEARDGHAFIIVRGISDFADERKQELDAIAGDAQRKGAWRRYAVLSAGEFLLRLAPTIAERMTPAIEDAPPEPSPADKRVELLEELESELATRYRHRTAITRVLKHATVDSSNAELDGSPKVMWYAALEAAAGQGKVGNVVRKALRDYPDTPALLRLLRQLDEEG
jgi:nucleoside phosphorylase